MTTTQSTIDTEIDRWLAAEMRKPRLISCRKCGCKITRGAYNCGSCFTRNH